MRFQYYKWFPPQLKFLDISFALGHGMLLSKLSSGWWFLTPWRSCGVTVMMMLQNAISVLQMISSAFKVFGYFFCSQSWHAVEQIAKLTVIWDPMALIWSHCNDNAAKCDFSITNVYVSIERVLMFPLLLARICRWTNNWVGGDLTLNDTHVGSL